MYKKIKALIRWLMGKIFSKNKDLQTKNLHSIDWPKTQDEFEEFWNEDEAMKNYFEASRLKFYNEVLQFIPRSYKKILDIGCGNGYFLSKIAERDKNHGENMIGVDYAESGFENGRSLLSKTQFIKSVAEKMPFSDETFDVIIMMETLEHLEKWKEALDEAYRVLSKGGCFIVTAPDGDIDKWAGHTNFWNEQEFRKNLSVYGLFLLKKIDEKRTFVAVIKK